MLDFNKEICSSPTLVAISARRGVSGYGTHSLRRTNVALIYKKTGNLRACQLLLGQRKLERTVHTLASRSMTRW
jgi:hypothetical protein